MSSNTLQLLKSGYKTLQEMKINEDIRYMSVCHSLDKLAKELSDKEREELKQWVELEEKIQKNEGLF